MTIATSDSANGASLQKQVDEQAASSHKKFGTFGGVFIPTLLTILGVIMYLREGWVVGNAGLLGAGLIILLAVAITALTGLSMSSITTNIRIGAGGAFSIISQSLGLEVGGSIGIPLYLSQALAVTMYIFGFREGWTTIFPHHPALLVDVATFGVLFLIALISANLAFRIQYVIMVIIAASLVSVFGTIFTGAMQYQPTWWGAFPGAPETGFAGTNFWLVFAVFFPAATGIMAGANMSGELKDPRRSIPLGTMAAIGISAVIYLTLAYWLARVATPDELVNNYTIMIDRALWAPIVLAGLLGATFSSGLSSLVGAPRILQALSMHHILPGGRVFARKTKAGEPRNAMLLTGGIVLGALMLRDLNAIAPLITMFFLITYAMINVVVLIEQSLGLISFRPRLRVPALVPLLGTVGCFFVMFIVNPVFSLVAVVLVLIFYFVLLRRQLQAPFGDLRSGLFVSVAEWAAKRVNDLPIAQERAWKPNIMAPVEDPAELRGVFQFIRDLSYPRGSVKLVGLAAEGQEARLVKRLPELSQAFRDQGVYTTSTVITDGNFAHALMASLQALSGAFFRPNILFLTLSPDRDEERDRALQQIVRRARENRMGVLLLADHPKARLGRRQAITVWMRDQSPDWRLSMHLGNIDLALLSAYMLRRNWRGKLKLVTVVNDAEQMASAEVYLRNLVDLARIPDADVYVEQGNFSDYLNDVHRADLHVLGFPNEINLDFVRRMVQETRSACLFVRDSGEENVLA